MKKKGKLIQREFLYTQTSFNHRHIILISIAKIWYSILAGFVIKKMQEDGSCLFRAVADQIYGDEEMHCSVRRHCMDYIVSRFEF